MSKILQRISQFTESQQFTISALEREINASKGVLSRALNNGTDIQSKWLEAIVEKYPQINSEWLLIGEGEMLKTEKLDGEEPQPLVQEPEDAVTKLIARIESLVAENTRLKIQLEQLQGTKKAAD